MLYEAVADYKSFSRMYIILVLIFDSSKQKSEPKNKLKTDIKIQIREKWEVEMDFPSFVSSSPFLYLTLISHLSFDPHHWH